VTVYWGGDNAWYSGTITAFYKLTRKVRIRYDDGDSRLHAMWEEEYRFLASPSVKPSESLAAPSVQPNEPCVEVVEELGANSLPLALSTTPAPSATHALDLPGEHTERPLGASGGAASVSVAKEILDGVRHITNCLAPPWVTLPVH
jgi:hypothetical protein